MFSNEKNDLNKNENLTSKNSKNTQNNENKNVNNIISKKTEARDEGGKINSGFLTDSSTGTSDTVDVVYAIPKRNNTKRPQSNINPKKIEGVDKLNNIPTTHILDPNSVFIEGIDYASKSSRKHGTPFPLNKKIKTKKSFYLSHYPVLYLPLIVCFLLLFLCTVAGVTFFIIRNETNIANNTSSSEFNWWLTSNKTMLLNSTLNYFTKSSSSTTNFVNTTIATVFDPHNKFDKKICGSAKNNPRSKQYRIMKGDQAMPRAWPWVVSIGFYGPKASLAHACGGALINKRFLLTASHCVIEDSMFGLVGRPVLNSDLYGSLARMMRVYVGITKRSKDINQNNTYRVSKIVSYPDFDATSFKNDLTIIQLERDITETDDNGFICVKKNTITNPGTLVYAVGWGFTEKNLFKASDDLMQVQLPIQAKQACGLSYLPFIQFCAGDPHLGKDSCNGDSGGPVMQLLDDSWSLVGIVSNGDAMCTGKGIYTNISFYLEWILDKTILV